MVVELVDATVRGAYWEGPQASLDCCAALVRGALRAAGGYEAKRTGDGFLLAFSDPAAALRFGRDLAALLAAEPWPDGPVAALLGIHTGSPVCEPSPTSGRMDYLGPVPNKASRLAGAAHPGQILLSDETVTALGASAGLVDLGSYGLRGLEGAHRIWQAGDATYPRPRAVDLKRTNLTPRRDRFIGRDRELAELLDRLRGEGRLLTLVGPGGTGKTRLAVELALRALREDHAEAWFVDLSETGDVDGVAAAVAHALDLPVGLDAPEVLGRALAGRAQALVVLDNVEQVVAVVAELVHRWRRAAPAVTWLLTSRVPLHVAGEAVFVLEALAERDAIGLYLERARWGAQDEAVVGALVRALDRLPLAIELAASRAGVLSAQGILDRMGDRFSLLASRGEGRPDRHATLRACLDWSWELLRPEAALALASLSVFEGSFTLEAAEAVLGPDALDRLVELHDHSLLVVSADHRRYSLLRTVHDYAADRLPPLLWDAAEERHIRHYAAQGEDEALRRLTGPDGGSRSRQLREDLDQLRAACERALQRGEGALAARCALAAWEVYELAGPFDLGERLVASALRAASLPAPDRAALLLRHVRALRLCGRLPEARAAQEALEALEVANAGPRAAGLILLSRGMLQVDMGQAAQARDAMVAAAERFVACGDVAQEGMAHANLGVALRRMGQASQALAHLERALILLRRAGHRRAEGVVLTNLSNALEASGQPARALALAKQAVEINRAQGNLRFEAVALNNLANRYMELGAMEQARGALLLALEQNHLLGAHRSEAIARGNLGVVCAALGDGALAEASLVEASARLEGLGDLQYAALYAVELAIWFGRQIAPDRAAPALERATRLLATTPNTQEPTALLRAQAAVTAARGDLGGARAILDEAERALDAAGVAPGVSGRVQLDELRRWLAQLGAQVPSVS